MANIYKGTLGLVGNTPLVEVTNIEKELGLEATVIVKLEYFNPAGSVKDRIAKAMVEDAEEKGLLKEGSVIIEPTSGNTGIGLASIAAAKGYRIILTIYNIFFCKYENEASVFLNSDISWEETLVKVPTCYTGNRVFFSKEQGNILQRLPESRFLFQNRFLLRNQWNWLKNAILSLYAKCAYKEIERPKEVVHSTMNRFFLKTL